MRRAVYPGSFDPLTNGHIDIIARAARLVDELLVAVVRNPNKTPLFTLAEREAMLRESLAPFENVRVLSFEGLLVEFVRSQEANIIVRGLRAVSDFEIEFQMALLNRKLAPAVEPLLFERIGYPFAFERVEFGYCLVEESHYAHHFHTPKPRLRGRLCGLDFHCKREGPVVVGQSRVGDESFIFPRYFAIFMAQGGAVATEVREART